MSINQIVSGDDYYCFYHLAGLVNIFPVEVTNGSGNWWRK